MELFDLEIPIRSTGVSTAKADFAQLERSAVETAAKTEQAVGRSARAVTQSAAQGVSASTRITRAIMAQEAAQRANAEAAQRAANRVTQGMARIERDVLQASAAFKAGTISARDYQTALRFARAEAAALAGTAGSLSGTTLKQFNNVMATTVTRAAGVGKGLGTVRSSVAAMAATMIGARSTVGTLVGSLLMFTGGSALALGVVAGVGAMALAYQGLTRRSREQKEQNDKLRDSFRELNEEMNKGPAAQRAVEDRLAGDLRRRITTLETQLAEARENERRAVDPDERFAQRTARQGIEARLERARQQLRGSEANLAQDDARREVDAADRRRAALISLASAGKATAEQQAQLRAELGSTRRELAALTPAYTATADGIERQAELTERAASIEEALKGPRQERTRQEKSALEVLSARVSTLVALGQALNGEGEVVPKLTEALRQLNAMEREGLETDEERLMLTRARIAAANELARLEPGVRGPIQQRFEDVPPPLVSRDQRVTDPFAGNQVFGPEPLAPSGFASGKSFSESLADGVEAGEARVRRAVARVSGALEDEAITKQQDVERRAMELGSILGAGVEAAIVAAVSGGSMTEALGNMVIQFGVAVMKIGALMAAALEALSSLNPFAAIAVGAALVALGSAMRGAASDAFGGRASAGGTGSALPVPDTIIRVALPGATRPGVEAAKLNPVQVTYFGGRDPGFERFLGDQIKRAGGRGV